LYIGIAAHSEEPDMTLIVKSHRFLEELWSMCGSTVRLVLGGYWGLMKLTMNSWFKFINLSTRIYLWMMSFGTRVIVFNADEGLLGYVEP
jgi:hypothetical protein